MSDSEDSIKGITKVVAKFIEVIKFTKENWYILVLFSGILWGVAKFYYYSLVEPEVRSYVTTIVYDLGKDSIPRMVQIELDTLMHRRGVSFRSELAPAMGLDKSQVADSISGMYISYKAYQKKSDEFEKFVGYTSGVFHLLIKESFSLYTTPDGVEIWDAPSGDTYYFDGYGYLWSATWSNADKCYYYFPPYNNNDRTKCL